IDLGRAPLSLALPATALLRHPPLTGRPRRAGSAPRLRYLQGGGELLAQALQRQLAVASLATGVLGDGGDPRAQLGLDSLPLRGVEGSGGGHVEYRLDP